jgi:hypothetical protein
VEAPQHGNYTRNGGIETVVMKKEVCHGNEGVRERRCVHIQKMHMEMKML